MFLEIRGIKKSFGTGDSRVNVLKGLDLDIEKGEFCVLLGPSGSGKSTLLNIIGGIDGVDERNSSDNGKSYHEGYDQALQPQMFVSIYGESLLKFRQRIRCSPLSLYPPQNNREHKGLH